MRAKPSLSVVTASAGTRFTLLSQLYQLEEYGPGLVRRPFGLMTAPGTPLLAESTTRTNATGFFGAAKTIQESTARTATITAIKNNLPIIFKPRGDGATIADPLSPADSGGEETLMFDFSVPIK